MPTSPEYVVTERLDIARPFQIFRKRNMELVGATKSLEQAETLISLLSDPDRLKAN